MSITVKKVVAFTIRAPLFIVLYSCAWCTTMASDVAISGVVLDRLGYPIPQARIAIRTIHNQKAVAESLTGPRGEFAVRQLPDGEFELEVRAKGFLQATFRPIRYAFPLPVRLDLQLPTGVAREGGVEAAGKTAVFGTVSVADAILTDYQVCLLRNWKEYRCASVNEYGQYLIEASPQSYVLIVRHMLRQILEKPVILNSAGLHRVDLQATRQ